MPNQRKNKRKKPLNLYARFSGVAIQMGIIIGIGAFIGVKLDEKYPNQYNGYTIICALFAVIGAMIYVIRRILQFSKKK